MLELLDDTRKRVESGEIDGLAVCYTSENRGVLWGFAWKNDGPSMWARICAALGSAYFDLMKNGLPKDEK